VDCVLQQRHLYFLHPKSVSPKRPIGDLFSKKLVFNFKNNFLVSRMPFAQHNRGFGHFFSAASSSRREAMVGGALARASAFRVGLGVIGATIVSGSCACPSHLCISRVLTSSSSLGISSLFCRATSVCEACRFLNSSFLSLITPTHS
jgi:hypothetical protein